MQVSKYKNIAFQMVYKEGYIYLRCKTNKQCVLVRNPNFYKNIPLHTFNPCKSVNTYFFLVKMSHSKFLKPQTPAGHLFLNDLNWQLSKLVV